jgi:hypothetical protein
MSRIIINIQEGIDPREAVSRVVSVMREGRVSGSGDREQYCYVTTWKSGYIVYADLTRKGHDTFRVHYEKP